MRDVATAAVTLHHLAGFFGGDVPDRHRRSRAGRDQPPREPAGDPEMVALSDPSRSDFWPDGRMSIAVSCDDVCEPIHEVS